VNLEDFTPPVTTAIKTERAGEVGLTYQKHSTRVCVEMLMLRGNGLMMNVRPHDVGRFSLHVMIHSEGVTPSVFVTANTGPEDIVDTMLLDPAHRDLMARATALTGELLANTEFTSFLTEHFGDTSGRVQDHLKMMSEGRYGLTYSKSIFGIARFVGSGTLHGFKDKLVSGYSIGGPLGAQIINVGSVNTDHLDLAMLIAQTDPPLRMHLNPETGTNEVVCRSPSGRTASLEEIALILERVGILLEYALSQVPALKSHGFLDGYDDFERIVSQCALKLKTYPVKLIEPPSLDVNLLG
jgi:hypothetical protein